MRLVHIIGGIPDGFRSHIDNSVGEWWLFKMSLIISTRLDPIAVDLGEIWGHLKLGTCWNRLTSGRRIQGRMRNCRRRSGCHGLDGCCDAVMMTVVPREFWFSGELSQSDPDDRTVPGSCKTGTENEFPPVCGCTLLLYCFHNRLSQINCVTEVPNEVAQVVWLPVLGSGYDVVILELP